MPVTNSKNSITLDEGVVFIGDKPISFPNLSFISELGRGANAAVFKATDSRLNRPVAVKIWNTRGISRAQFETVKMAHLNHPRVVTTYYSDRVGEQPFAVMELAAGSSAKRWIQDVPTINARWYVWSLYSETLRFVHEAGQVHGDPHLGNVLVFEDFKQIYGKQSFLNETKISIKLADAGTSIFWSPRHLMKVRESKKQKR